MNIRTKKPTKHGEICVIIHRHQRRGLVLKSFGGPGSNRSRGTN